jgi:hypothetical protein
MTTLRQIYDSLVAEHATNTQGEMVTTFSDKGTMHSYIEYYERHFEPHRDLASILEIGVMTGGSMLLWSEYFDSVFLTGVDLRVGFNQPLPFQAELEDVVWHWGVDSTNADQVPTLKQHRFVIDDGAHDMLSQMATFKNYWSALQPGGTYFIEDVEDDVSESFLKGFLQGYLRDTEHSIEVYRGFAHRADDRIIAITKENK